MSKQSITRVYQAERSAVLHLNGQAAEVYEGIELTGSSGSAQGYVAEKDIRKKQGTWLEKALKLENGVPDASTFRNVIRAIDTHQSPTAFVEWMGALWEASQVRRRWIESRLGGLGMPRNSAEVVSAFAAVWGIMTIDAMGTWTKIAKEITKKGGSHPVAEEKPENTL